VPPSDGRINPLLPYDVLAKDRSITSTISTHMEFLATTIARIQRSQFPILSLEETLSRFIPNTNGCTSAKSPSTRSAYAIFSAMTTHAVPFAVCDPVKSKRDGGDFHEAMLSFVLSIFVSEQVESMDSIETVDRIGCM
jgi:hypothetical protein